MKKIYWKSISWIIGLLLGLQIWILSGDGVDAAQTVPEELQNLHAQSAVLMDGDSGRVLFEKNGYEKRAMASTTKILTCILALEKGDLEQVVTVSKNAARQPKVHLGMQEGEKFFLKDLLYSLMLESHNDSAVAIAEAIAGSTEEFAVQMNEKAREIGCRNSHFITPNGLDASDEEGKHSATAEELAKIMRYCIKESEKRENFLKITGTQEKTFQNIEKTRSFSCVNHNALLQMEEGALAGKTGFTSEAGYCYVGAVKKGDRTLIVALLGCGWPSHKSWKWQDTKSLLRYGFGHYRYREIKTIPKIPAVKVAEGCKENSELFSKIFLHGTAEKPSFRMLLKDDEKISVKVKMNEQRKAPVCEGELIGTVLYTLDGKIVYQTSVLSNEEIHRRNFWWVFKNVIKIYLI